MNIKKITILFFTLCLFLSANVFAVSEDEQEVFDQYNVEVLIFEQTHQVGIDGEQWREVVELEERDSSAFALSPNAISLSDIREGKHEDMIVELPSTSLTLADTRDRLENAIDYRVLYHKSWHQSVRAKDESTAILIEIPGLSGSVYLHKQRFLHFSADLLFNSLEGDVRLEESRRLKSKELHYFDHPLFGLLVRVVKTENDQI